jgi:prepilin-type N-terminal cleavage/methylation domain-containing protein
MRLTRSRGFTIIELLVVMSIIGIMMGILLPAIGRARDQAKLTQSQVNLRNLGAAHASYASEWNDRQIKFCDDNLSRYGHNEEEAYAN